jgi:hypothetical protein
LGSFVLCCGGFGTHRASCFVHRGRPAFKGAALAPFFRLALRGEKCLELDHTAKHPIVIESSGVYQVRGARGAAVWENQSRPILGPLLLTFLVLFSSPQTRNRTSVILGPCTSRMEALPLGRAAEGATPAPGPSSEDTLAFEAASEPLSEHRRWLHILQRRLQPKQ